MLLQCCINIFAETIYWEISIQNEILVGIMNWQKKGGPRGSFACPAKEQDEQTLNSLAGFNVSAVCSLYRDETRLFQFLCWLWRHISLLQKRHRVDGVTAHVFKANSHPVRFDRTATPSAVSVTISYQSSSSRVSRSTKMKHFATMSHHCSHRVSHKNSPGTLTTIMHTLWKYGGH